METEPLGSELRTKHLRYRDLVFTLLALFAVGIVATIVVVRLSKPLLISFMSDRNENFEIFTMEMDSAQVANISNHEAED